jgi:hypothetical protein
MTFLLRVDGDRWQAQLAGVLAAQDDPATGGLVVPVVKSNGYGLGPEFLCRRLAAHGRDVVAVGTAGDALEPGFAWDGDLLVLTPWQVADRASHPTWDRLLARHGDRVLTTVADAPSLLALAGRATAQAPRRILLEGRTPVERFGFERGELEAVLTRGPAAAALASGALQLHGLALHLPMVAPQAPPSGAGRQFQGSGATGPVVAGSGRVQVAADWGLWWLALAARLGAALDPRAELSRAAELWVSHLAAAELRDLRAALPDVPIRPRVGTALWLGDPGALQASGVVLAVHPGVPGGAGYFQKRLPKGAALAVVGGGTSHGVALSGPLGSATLRRRASTAGTGLLEAAGRSLSPFRLAGQRLWFHEAPHASVSLLVVPRGTVPPRVGDELDCRIRFTTARFDAVLGG